MQLAISQTNASSALGRFHADPRPLVLSSDTAADLDRNPDTAKAMQVQKDRLLTDAKGVLQVGHRRRPRLQQAQRLDRNVAMCGAHKTVP